MSIYARPHKTRMESIARRTVTERIKHGVIVPEAFHWAETRGDKPEIIAGLSGIGGIRKAWQELLRREDPSEEEEMMEGISRMGGRNPDLWFIAKAGQIFHVYWVEIEDTWKLTPEKLEQLSELWFFVDGSERWCFYVATVDRYGDNWRELDLCQLFYTIQAQAVADGRL